MAEGLMTEKWDLRAAGDERVSAIGFGISYFRRLKFVSDFGFRISNFPIAALGLCLFLAGGCGDSSVTRALDSDSNGYFCPNCQARFFTDRAVFADYCPQCRSAEIQAVVGYVCSADGQTTLAGRSKGAARCSKCGKPTTGLKMPAASDLIAWGAVKKSAADVGGAR